MQKITPFLWFDGQAEEAVAFYLPKQFVLIGVAIAFVAFIGSTIFAVWVVFRFLQRRRNDLLGYLSERAVAEQLEGLRALGWRISMTFPRKVAQKSSTSITS